MLLSEFTCIAFDSVTIVAWEIEFVCANFPIIIDKLVCLIILQ